jgi:cytoskeletal protein CcmA (bactofilin family)
MFSKPTKAAEAADGAASRSTPVVASLIAADVAIRGDVQSAGDMHLDGAVEGDLKVARLVIGEGGAVNGQIHAEWVEVRGRVTGSIAARTVKLHATARVDGDITHAELAIESGAHFEGRSLVFAPAAETPLSVAAE